MIKNYLKVAWRNLMKSKIFSFINIIGLSVGLTCCMLITVYLYNEVSYDKYHKNIDHTLPIGNHFRERRQGRKNTQYTCTHGSGDEARVS